DFAQHIRPLTIIGKLVGLRRAPTRVRCLISATEGATAYWVGDGAAVSMSAAAFTGEVLDVLKVAAITVVTKEVASSSLPAAEQMISRDLTNAMVQAMDEAFVSPANSGVSGEKPA